MAKHRREVPRGAWAGRRRWLVVGCTAVALSGATVVGVLLGPADSPGPRPTTTAAQAVPTPSPEPTRPAALAALVYDGPVASTVDEAVRQAQGWGAQRFDRTAVVVIDRFTGAETTAGDAEEYFRSASLVKLFIATRMLVQEQPFTASTQDLMWRMITCSDDSAGSTLWWRVGAGDVVDWVAQRYDLGDLIARPTPDRPDAWGLTRVSALGLARFYEAVANDPVVSPWLFDAMGHAAPEGCDGYYQHFGLPSAAVSWRVKQGWIHNDNGHAYLHTTGLVGKNRWIVVILTQGPASLYSGDGREYVTGMAQALLPYGSVPNVTQR